ncbi:MAG: hypothetical protein KC646_18230 [Candidatus Cloacimonetes bacterium]|nr:hypothetical protein [Candidatus Cloacimonadota bacterium]
MNNKDQVEVKQDTEAAISKFKFAYFIFGLIIGVIIYLPLTMVTDVDKHLYTNKIDYPILKKLPQALNKYIELEKKEPKFIEDLYPKYISRLPYSVFHSSIYGALDVKIGRPWEGLDGPEKLTIMFKDKYGLFGDSYTQIDFNHKKQMYVPRDAKQGDQNTDYIESYNRGNPLPNLPVILIILVFALALTRKLPRLHSTIIGTALTSLPLSYSFLFV